MRFKQYISEEEEENNLYGKVINAIIITPSIEKRPWNRQFKADGLELTSLKGSPRDINGTFDCSDNKLTSLINGPASVSKDFWCWSNQLTSLEGAPTFIGILLDCTNNPITSLHNIHKHLRYVSRINFHQCPIKSNILGLLLIDGLKTVKFDDKKLESIILRHLPEGKNSIIKCQNELLEAGYEDMAKL